MSNLDLRYRQALSELQSATSELRSVQSAHAQCSSSSASLSNRVAALSLQNSEADVAAKRYEAELARLSGTIEAQSSRLQTLESAAAASSARASAASSSGEETARQAKLKLAKSKDRLREKETQVATLLDDLAGARTALALSEKREQESKSAFGALQTSSSDELARLRHELSNLQSSARKSAAASSSASHRREREEASRRERDWYAEKKTLLEEIETLRQTNATALEHAVAAASSSTSTRSRADESLIASLEGEVARLQQELQALRSQLDQSQAHHDHLRSDHAKVSGALNRLLSSGGVANTITIASKKGMFPEFVQLKRDKEQLEALVLELKQANHALQMRLAQAQAQGSGASQQSSSTTTAAAATTGLSNIQQLQRIPSRPQVSRHQGGLALIAAHEASSPPPVASSASSSMLGVDPSLSRGIGVGGVVPALVHSSSSAAHRAANGATFSRRSSGGWPASVIANTGKRTKK